MTDQEATTALAIPDSRQVAQALRESVSAQIAKQSRITWMKKREMIPGGAGATQETVRLVDNIVKLTGIPYNYIALIPGNRGSSVQPYIMADGWFLKARCDERGIADITYDVKIDEMNQSCLVYCWLTLGTGQKFQGAAYKRLSDEKSKTSTMTALVNKCITQARGKAAYLAVGVQFPGIAEDVQDYVDAEVKVIEKIVPKNGSIANTAVLMSKAKQEYGLDLPGILKILGVTGLGQIQDLQEAWSKIQASKSKKEG